MKIVTPGMTRLAVVLFITVTAPCAFAQSISKTNAAPSKPRGERIEFSGTTNGPAMPKLKTGIEDLEDRLGIRELPESANPSLAPDYSPPMIQRAPTKRDMEKAWREFDRKKNWAFPDGKDENDPSKALSKDGKGLEDDEDAFSNNNRESVMTRYLNGSDAKNPNRRGPLGRGKDSNDRDDRDTDRDERTDSKTDREKEKASKLNDPDANGLAQFNLGAYINPGAQHTGFGDMSNAGRDRWNQSGRNDFNSFARTDRPRAERERDAERSAAEFNQILKPRGGGLATSPSGGFSDPINIGGDLTRRDINPIVPRGLGSSLPTDRPSFGMPTPGRDSRPDNMDAVFGVAGPGASSLAPTMRAPSADPAPVMKRGPFIPEPPRKPF